MRGKGRGEGDGGRRGGGGKGCRGEEREEKSEGGREDMER